MILTQTFKTFLQFILAPKRPVYKNLLDFKCIKVNIQKNITDFKVTKNKKKNIKIELCIMCKVKTLS